MSACRRRGAAVSSAVLAAKEAASKALGTHALTTSARQKVGVYGCMSVHCATTEPKGSTIMAWPHL